MKRQNVFRKLVVCSLLAAALITGCGKSSYKTAPFTTLDWDATLDDVVALEGEDYEEDASYLGHAYDYPKTYNDVDGTIRYVISEDDGTLKSVSWTYEAPEGSDISEMFITLHDELEDELGESGEYTEDATTCTDIWRREAGNITIISIISTDYNALMLSYLSPDSSTN